MKENGWTQYRNFKKSSPLKEFLHIWGITQFSSHELNEEIKTNQSTVSYHPQQLAEHIIYSALKIATTVLSIDNKNKSTIIDMLYFIYLIHTKTIINLLYYIYILQCVRLFLFSRLVTGASQ